MTSDAGNGSMAPEVHLTIEPGESCKPSRPQPDGGDASAPAAPGDGVYRLLFQRNPWPMWVYDRQTLQFLAVNRAAIAAYGWNEAEFLARRIVDIRPDEDREPLLAHLTTLGSAPVSAGAEPHPWRHRRRNGEVFDVDVVSEAIEFAGRPARLVMAKDITQRLRAERALRDSERRYRNIVETATEGIWAIDADALTRFVNPKMAQMLGHTVDQMMGRPLLDFMDAQGVAIAEANLERRRQGLAEQHEFKFQRSDGTALWTSVSTNPVQDDAGAYAGALAMVTDITGRKRAEARDASRNQVMALIAAGAPLDTVLDAIVRGLEATQPGARCSVLLLDASGTRLRHGAAPGMPDFFNQAVDGLVIGPLSGSCGTAAHLGRRVISEDVRSDPRWAAYRDLAARADVVAAWSEPVLNHAGQVLGSFGVYRRQPHRPDDAETTAVAEAARMAAIAIERKQADDALRQAQKMESLGTLAGGVAHDFNNILGAILGNLALARQAGDVGPASAARLDQIGQSALRARHLVQQILAFSRRQPRAPQHQALAPLVEDTLGLLRATLPAGVRIATRLAEGVPPAAVDANQIQQVLMNLCTNAWHAIVESANAAGEIEIGLDALALDGSDPSPTAAALASLPAGGCVHLWVRDNGAGMDALVQSRIFEPFFTTKPVGTGTGLGLAVVHGIVSEHGGVISVDSAPGRGSTFHLYLPAAAAADAAVLPPVAAAGPADAGPVLAPGAAASGAVAPHILCVDDDAVILLTDEGLLQGLGYRVTALASGAEAVAAVRESPQGFDLVVTDFNMPDTSGLDVARQIAAIRPDLPVLICSGYIDADLQARAAQAGVRALVHKENTVEELGPTILRVLGGRSAFK